MLYLVFHHTCDPPVVVDRVTRSKLYYDGLCCVWKYATTFHTEVKYTLDPINHKLQRERTNLFLKHDKGGIWENHYNLNGQANPGVFFCVCFLVYSRTQHKQLPTKHIAGSTLIAWLGL